MITRQMAAQKNKSATTGIPRLFFTLTGNVNKSFINVDTVRMLLLPQLHAYVPPVIDQPGQQQQQCTP